MGLKLHPVQKIVNVQWGGSVIVVFVSTSPFLEQPEASYEVIEDKAKLLSTFRAKEESAQSPGYPCSAFKVAQNAGKFITSKVPTLPSTEQPLGLSILVCVFSTTIEGDEQSSDASLERAVAGTKLIVPAIFNIFSSEPSDLPADLSPPGLLWIVTTGMMDSGQSLTWKMRYGKHREESEDQSAEADKPPNSMAQCYHLESYTGPSGGLPPTINWSGYKIYCYRLDKKGIETVYGKLKSTEEATIQTIDPAWKQIVGTPGEIKGIPADDPPPLIESDLETS